MSRSSTPFHSAPPNTVAQQPIVSQAKMIAYRAGIRELEGLVLRIEELEAQVRELRGSLRSNAQEFIERAV